MPALAVVEDLDVLRDLAPDLLPRLIALMVHEFILQRAPKAFYRRIVVAVALSTHGHCHAELAQPILIVLGTILGPATRVMDEPWAWAFGPDGTHQRLAHQVRRHPGTHRMTDHLTRVEILHSGQIQPPFSGRHVDDVGDPGLVRAPGVERVRQKVVRHGKTMIRPWWS